MDDECNSKIFSLRLQIPCRSSGQISQTLSFLLLEEDNIKWLSRQQRTKGHCTVRGNLDNSAWRLNPLMNFISFVLLCFTCLWICRCRSQSRHYQLMHILSVFFFYFPVVGSSIFVQQHLFFLSLYSLPLLVLFLLHNLS